MNSYTPSAERPESIERIRAAARGVPYHPNKKTMIKERPKPTPDDCRSLFTIERGNRWLDLARREPEAKQLFGELWHEGELCMLFADTNIGKSVLAVQIGESIARGEGIGPFACQAEPERVAYFDFELTRRQFLMRYSRGEEDHQFSDNFYRAEFNFVDDLSPNVDENELLIAAIEYKLNLVKAKVLIIDNITCLRGGTENSAVALSLMKSLKALKTDNKLSILVLAHTPKRRNATKPISADDLHGSKLLVNFADSAFAIGKSTTDTNLCYLKQIKQRNTRQRYGDDNICLCRIQKPGTFLHFEFEGYGAERRHLLTYTASQRLHLAGEIAALSAAGFTQREIAMQLGIGLATVNKWLNHGGGGNQQATHEADTQPGTPLDHKEADAGLLANGETLHSGGKYVGGNLNNDRTGDDEGSTAGLASKNNNSIDQVCSPADEENEEEDADFEEDLDEEDAGEDLYNGTSGPLSALWPEDDNGPGAPPKPAAVGIYETRQTYEKLPPELPERLNEFAELLKSIEIVKCDGTSEPFVNEGEPDNYS